MNICSLDKTAQVNESRTLLVRTHSPPCRLETLVTEPAHRPLRGRNHAIDERLRRIILHLIAANKHVHDVGNVHLLDKGIRTVARRVPALTQLAALLRQGVRAADELVGRAVEGRGAVELLVDAALQAADLYPHGRHRLRGHGCPRVREEVKLKDAGDVNVALVDDGGAAQADPQALVEGVDVPEEDTLDARNLGRVVLERVLAVEAAGDAELRARRGKVPRDGWAGDVDGVEALS